MPEKVENKTHPNGHGHHNLKIVAKTVEKYSESVIKRQTESNGVK